MLFAYLPRLNYFSVMSAIFSSETSPSLKTAIEVFLGGVAFARSYTHPYQVDRLGQLWVMRDAPRKQAADYRREEWVVCNLDPVKADELIRRQTRGRFCICAIRPLDEADEPLRSNYKAAGYRLGSTEAIMMHMLDRVSDFAAPFPIHRVATAEMAEHLNKAARRRQIRAQDLGAGTKIRSYVAMDEDRVIGWASSIAVGEHTWIQSMFVAPLYRRRGIGKAILTQVLHDDRTRGAKSTFLTASHAGAMLYPHVGFETIGQLLLYTPRR